MNPVSNNKYISLVGLRFKYFDRTTRKSEYTTYFDDSLRKVFGPVTHEPTKPSVTPPIKEQMRDWFQPQFTKNYEKVLICGELTKKAYTNIEIKSKVDPIGLVNSQGEVLAANSSFYINRIKVFKNIINSFVEEGNKNKYQIIPKIELKCIQNCEVLQFSFDFQCIDKGEIHNLLPFKFEFYGSVEGLRFKPPKYATQQQAFEKFQEMLEEGFELIPSQLKANLRPSEDQNRIENSTCEISFKNKEGKDCAVKCMIRNKQNEKIQSKLKEILENLVTSENHSDNLNSGFNKANFNHLAKPQVSKGSFWRNIINFFCCFLCLRL